MIKRTQLKVPPQKESPLSLNPKLVPHRNTNVEEDKVVEPNATISMTPYLTNLDSSKLQKTRRATPGRKGSPSDSTRLSENRSKRAVSSSRGVHLDRLMRPTCSPTRLPVSARSPYTQNYSHVRSVVKELIDNKITPLDARYWRAMRKTTPHNSSTSLSGRNFPASARVSPLSSRTAAAHIKSKNSTSLVSPIESDSQSGFMTSVFSDAFCGDILERRRKWEGYRTHLRESPHVAKVLENLDSARVPYHYVPRCAKEIPERYKYHPRTTPESNELEPPLEEGDKLKDSQNLSEAEPTSRRSNSLTFRQNSGLRRTSSANLVSTKKNERNVNGFTNIGEVKEISQCSQLFSNGTTADRRSSLKSGNVSTPLKYAEKESKEDYIVLKTRGCSKEIRCGMKEVLLFDMEPPREL